MSDQRVFAYLCVRDAAAAIDTYCEAFGATERFRLVDPSDGRVGHAEIEILGHVLMLSDAFPEMGVVGPEALGGTPVRIHLHVDDCDAAVARAVAAGATVIQAPRDQFYGERSAKVRDPFGHEWLLGHSLEEVDPTEMQRRYDAMVG